MADVTPVTTITPGSSAKTKKVTLGATATAGQWVYKKSTDGKYYLAQADGTAEEAEVAGLLVTGGVNGQPGIIVEEGPVSGYTGVKAGQVYVLSNTAGSMALESDLTEDTSRLSVVAVGTAVGSLYVKPIVSGAVVNLL